MTTIKDRVTSTKEEELPSVSVIEPLSVSNEVVVVIKKRIYSQISTTIVMTEQSFLASERAVVGADSQS